MDRNGSFCWLSRSPFSPHFNGRRAKLISWNLKAIEQWQIVNKMLHREIVAWVRLAWQEHTRKLFEGKCGQISECIETHLNCTPRRCSVGFLWVVTLDEMPCHVIPSENFLENNACSFGPSQLNCVSCLLFLPRLPKIPATSVRVRLGFIWYSDIWLMPSELLQLLKAFFRALLSLCTQDGNEMGKKAHRRGFRSSICWFLNGFELQLSEKEEKRVGKKKKIGIFYHYL